MLPTHNIMSRSKRILLQKLLRQASTAVQGGLSETTRTCGNPSCACHHDPARRHGPHLYLTFRSREGRSSAMYVPRAQEETVRKAVTAWAEAWNTLVAISHLNRKGLGDSMRQKAKVRTWGSRPRRKKS